MNNESSNKCVNVLWTGGWDSSFRVIQAVKQGKTVQPYYVIDTNRQSSLKEIKQMQKIRAALSAKYSNGTINEIKYINIDSLVAEPKYKQAHSRLLKQNFMGTQYIWLSALSKQISNLELCIHRDDKAEFFVNKLESQRANNPDGARDSDEELIFGTLKYPILNYTKVKMAEECKKDGDLDILNMSWFCFSPINDTPCGLCNPCKYSLEEGMQNRFTTRGKLYSKAPVVFGTVRKIARRFF